MSDHDVDNQVSLMTGPTAMPRSNGEVIFKAPWQSRAFGMAVGLSQAGRFPWDDFRHELAEAIARRQQEGVEEYWLSWLDALEVLLLRDELVDPDALHEREHEFRDHIREEVF